MKNEHLSIVAIIPNLPTGLLSLVHRSKSVHRNTLILTKSFEASSRWLGAFLRFRLTSNWTIYLSMYRNKQKYQTEKFKQYHC